MPKRDLPGQLLFEFKGLLANETEQLTELKDKIDEAIAARAELSKTIEEMSNGSDAKNPTGHVPAKPGGHDDKPASSVAKHSSPDPD